MERKVRRLTRRACGGKTWAVPTHAHTIAGKMSGIEGKAPEVWTHFPFEEVDERPEHMVAHEPCLEIFLLHSQPRHQKINK